MAEGKMQFTYPAYHQLLQILDTKGYVFCDYHNYQNIISPCILRHDVDFDPAKALDMARMESSMADIKQKVTSTYFFLINTEFYNLFASENRKILDEIQSLGHEIGLHFDETKYFYNDNIEQMIAKIQEELHLLSIITGKQVKAVSMHRPSQVFLELNLNIPNAVNSYNSEFFKSFHYVSDSRMTWREDIMSLAKNHQYDRLHVLTHPFWYSQAEEDMKTKLLTFIQNANKQRYWLVNKNFRDLGEFVLEKDI